MHIYTYIDIFARPFWKPLKPMGARAPVRGVDTTQQSIYSIYVVLVIFDVEGIRVYQNHFSHYDKSHPMKK